MTRHFILILIVLSTAVTPMSCGRDPAVKQLKSERSLFVFVRIPEPLMPLDRGRKYEDPLDLALKAAKLGEVTGGGSQLGATRADGTRGIEWVGIDVEVQDLERGIPFVKAELLRLGAPATTVLEFSRAGTKVEEVIK